MRSVTGFIFMAAMICLTVQTYVQTHEKDKKRLHPFFTQSGADRESNADQYIANMKDGSWSGYKYFLFDDLNSISISARGEGKGFMEIRTDRHERPICTIPLEAIVNAILFGN